MTTVMDRRRFLSWVLATGTLLALDSCTTQSDTTAQDGSGSRQEEGETGSGERSGGTLTSPLDNGYASGYHHATIEVENRGIITLELNATNTPITVSNFADLASRGFYDGLTFHRVIKGFMIQGGDPKGDGTGGSERTIKGEFGSNGITNAIQHKRGVISMARSAQNDSASSQFFIMQEDQSSLDGNYAAFGKVRDGMDIVDGIANDTPTRDDNGSVAPADQPRIVAIRMAD